MVRKMMVMLSAAFVALFLSACGNDPDDLLLKGLERAKEIKAEECQEHMAKVAADEFLGMDEDKLEKMCEKLEDQFDDVEEIEFKDVEVDGDKAKLKIKMKIKGESESGTVKLKKNKKTGKWEIDKWDDEASSKMRGYVETFLEVGQY